MQVYICEDIEQGARLWQKLWPDLNIFDCWQIRLGFHEAFKWPLHFLVARLSDNPVGLLPLSWIDEEGYYGCFPGEIWEGRTWLEQNRIPAISKNVQRALWEATPENTQLRYLHDNTIASLPELIPDEVGYLFYPPHFNYDYTAYLSTFSGKRRKQLLRELDKFEAMGCVWNIDELDDIEWMFEMNLKNFKERSYFYDPRFMQGFENILSFLSNNHLLRITTAWIKGQRAAVDVGVVYKNQYTVLAGGVDLQFPGIAKVINQFHLKWGCARHLDKIDFLCGDFGWKARFHLFPRCLYKVDKSMVNTEMLTIAASTPAATILTASASPAATILTNPRTLENISCHT